MIYSFRARDIYYAGINYFSRLERVQCSYLSTNNDDAFSYYSASDTRISYIVYKGVSLSNKRDMPMTDIRVCPTYWSWRDFNDEIHEEEYPHDL